jgi:hypothetical protein
MSGTAPGPDRAWVEGVVGASRSVLDGAKELARRSRRFSWLSWGFLYAAWAGVIVVPLLVLFFPSYTVTSTLGGGSYGVNVPPVWYYLIAFVPAMLLFVGALRELFAGRAAARAAIRGTPGGPRPPGGADEPVGWTQQVVDAQKLLTAAKLETDWSFLPLGIGLLGADSTFGTAVLSVALGTGGFGSILVVGIGAGVFLVGLYLLYRVAREWIGGFQHHVDRQVREVSALEAEFLWRFAGSPA